MGKRANSSTNERSNKPAKRRAGAELSTGIEEHISSLTAVVTKLTEQVSTLEAKVSNNVPIISDVPQTDARNTDDADITLEELRKLQPLQSKVDNVLSDLNIPEGISSIKLSGKAKNPRTTATRKIIFHILWPHQFVHRPGAYDLIFDNITLPEFVAGTSAILLSSEIKEPEKRARIEHLQFLMLLSRSYTWDSLRAMYAVALEDIQCGHRKWSDSLADLKDLMAVPQANDKQHTSPSNMRNVNTSCRKFNYEKCTYKFCRYPHVCYICSLQGKISEHPARACPFKKSSKKESESKN